MKIPSQTAIVEKRPWPADQKLRTPMAGTGIQPSIDIGCILRTAAGCFIQCGTDVPCLLACSPALIKCL